MAHFVVSEKLKHKWGVLEPIKIDLRTTQGQAQLVHLKETHELVQEVSDTMVNIRVYALVQGHLFWTYKLSNLKTASLMLAVKEKLSARRLKELLEPRPHRARKEFIKEMEESAVG